MSIEPIGLLTIIVGLLCLQLGYLATATTFVVATLFGAAAAVLIGSANIQPAHLFLAFVAATALSAAVRRLARSALSVCQSQAFSLCAWYFTVSSLAS